MSSGGSRIRGWHQGKKSQTLREKSAHRQPGRCLGTAPSSLHQSPELKWKQQVGNTGYLSGFGYDMMYFSGAYYPSDWFRKMVLRCFGYQALPRFKHSLESAKSRHDFRNMLRWLTTAPLWMRSWRFLPSMLMRTIFAKKSSGNVQGCLSGRNVLTKPTRDPCWKDHFWRVEACWSSGESSLLDLVTWSS